MSQNKDDSPFPKSVFPSDVFPRKIFPWMNGSEDGDAAKPDTNDDGTQHSDDNDDDE